jgi:hypothetical protein
MQRTISCPPLSPSDLDVNPTINVVIAYEDFDTGKHAKATYDFLVEHLGQDCQFTNQMWKFDVLSIPKLREIAAKDAVQADIVIISCHGTELPVEVKAWIELWLSEDTHPIALVALFDRSDDAGVCTKAVRAYLAGVALRGHMEFFAQPDEWPGKKGAEESFVFRRNLSAEKTLSSLAGVMERESSFPRWGINE